MTDEEMRPRTDEQKQSLGDEDSSKANELVPADAVEVQAVEAVVGAAAPTPTAPSSPDLFPAAPVLKKRTYSSTLSYVGITRRTTAWVRKTGARSTLAAVLATTAAVLFLIIMYAFLIVWYVIVLYGPLILFTLPFRLIRRSQRKSHHLQETQLATMQAMLVQQQQAMLKNQPPSDTQ